MYLLPDTSNFITYKRIMSFLQWDVNDGVYYMLDANDRLKYDAMV